MKGINHIKNDRIKLRTLVCLMFIIFTFNNAYGQNSPIVDTIRGVFWVEWNIPLNRYTYIIPKDKKVIDSNSYVNQVFTYWNDPVLSDSIYSLISGRKIPNIKLYAKQDSLFENCKRKKKKIGKAYISKKYKSRKIEIIYREFVGELYVINFGKKYIRYPVIIDNQLRSTQINCAKFYYIIDMKISH